MKCPKCGEQFVCPCKACTDRRGTQSKWARNGSNVICGGCGLTMPMEDWADEDYRQYQVRKALGKD